MSAQVWRLGRWLAGRAIRRDNQLVTTLIPRTEIVANMDHGARLCIVASRLEGPRNFDHTEPHEVLRFTLKPSGIRQQPRQRII